MKLKDVPDYTIFAYDSERAKKTIGPMISYRDIYFKLSAINNKNVRILHIPNRFGRITETTLGSNTEVGEEKRDSWIEKRAIQVVFAEESSYFVSYKVKFVMQS